MNGGRGRGRGVANPAQAPTSYWDAGRGRGRPTQPPSQQARQPPPQQARQPTPMEVEPQGGPSHERREDAGRPVTGRGGARAVNVDTRTIVTRPADNATKKGATGRKIQLQANFFKLLTRPKWTLYQYRVDMAPEQSDTFVRKALVRAHRELLHGYIFDGTVLFTPIRLSSDPLVLNSRAQDDSTVRITMKLVGDVVPGDHVYMHVFNILLRSCYEALHLKLMNRDYFDSEKVINVPQHRLQVWPGYRTTIAQHESDILMSVEIVHKIVRTDTVYDLLRNSGRSGGGSRQQNDFAKALIGQIVMTKYNSNTYRITDVKFNGSPRDEFDMKGKKVSYIEYYKTKYNLTIRDVNQPLLLSKPKPKDVRRGCPEMIVLIPEFCYMTGLDDGMRANFRLMKDLADHTRVSPANRIKRMAEFNSRLRNSDLCVKEFNKYELKIDSNLLTLDARLLPPISLFLEKKSEVKTSTHPDGWTRDLRGKRMALCSSLQNWAVVTVPRIRGKTETFVKLIKQTGQDMGMTFTMARYFESRGDTESDYTNAIDQAKSEDAKFIVVVLANKNDTLYSAIKRKCSVGLGIPSQIILGKTVDSKNAMSIATKVAIQINCKVGGVPWTISNPFQNSMVIGYDVCHDPKDKSMSYGAMVATMDQSLGRNFSCVARHSNGEEISNEFALNIRKAIDEYRTINKGAVPQTIFIYRDGVGEGQINYVYEHEVELIKKTLGEIYGGVDKVRLVFIVVTKRLNTRFFYNNNNPEPGTVIDDVVTFPHKFDFYLISQAVRNGTVSPTSYNVLANTARIGADHIQQFTYRLCHLYYNYSGQVRVPAPCQNAHKLAFLVSQTYQRSPHIALQNTSHFL